MHDNNEISKVDKFSYLKSLLEGAAAKAIQGLTLSDANYDSAIDLLKERFGKSQAIITAHMEELLKVPNCTSDRSYSLRSVYDKIIIHVRGLESLEVTSDQYGSLLIPIILSKFPSEIRLRVARESGDDTWDIDELLKIIRQEVEAREASETTHVSMQRLPTHNARSHGSPNPTASSLVTSGNNNIHCVYCNGNHFSASCTKVVTQNERKERLRKSGRCYNCLRMSHKFKNCDSPKNCRYCHHRHHQSLCEQCPTLKKDPPPQEKPPDPQSVTTNTSTQMRNKQVVLLQTAQVEAVSDHDIIPVRILLDNGSQLSYITISLKSRLKLKPVRQERLSLNTFGSDSFTTKGCDLVRVKLQRPGSNEVLEIMARTSPVICSSLPALVNVSKYVHLQNLDLADGGQLYQSRIDILIGSDYYWQIVTGDIVNADCGPVAMSSVFGWLLSGPVSHPTTDSTFHSLVVLGKDQCVSKNPERDHLVQMLKRFWDNETVGIHEIKPWKQYVANRVKEIRQLTSRDRWRHCPGNLNPADLPSRGLSGDRLLNSKLWWEGPPFLMLSGNEWPSEVQPHVNDVAYQEIVKNPPEVTHVLAAHNKPNPNLEAVIDCNRYSSLTRLLRVTALVFRAVKAFKQLIADEPVPLDIQLIAEDLQHAEVSWICHIQTKLFVKELEYLRSNGKLPTPTYVQQFGLFLDDKNIMKCKGRINNSTLSLAEKNPIFLPAKHPLIKLLVMHVHQQAKHGRVNVTLTALREKYWIVRGRQTIKSILRSCVVCKKLEGLPYDSPPSPDLPACRVSDDPPFAHTGVDFAGPLYVQESTDRELTRGLNVDSFLLAFRRFVGRRGLPASLLSDNAKTFRSSSKEVQSICRSSEVFRYLTNQQTSWTFIVPKAPWWGGFWERMVQTVKRSLRKVVGRAVLNFDELNTLLIEIESVINGRPLTFVYDDSEGISYALTPAHLLYGHRLATSPSGNHFEVTSTSNSLTRRAKNQKRLLNQFVDRWRKDYLLNLREFRVVKLKGQASCVKVGDIVILKDDNVRRVFWKLAKVIELLKGKDDIVRAALINVATDNGPPKILRRSIKQLIPIEVTSNDEGDEPTELSDNNVMNVDSSVNTADQLTHSTRPRRAAAILGEAARRNWTGL